VERHAAADAGDDVVEVGDLRLDELDQFQPVH
jgi:hypothetical protein